MLNKKELKKIIKAAYLEKKGKDQYYNTLDWKLATGRLQTNITFEIMEYLGTNNIKETLQLFERANGFGFKEEEIDNAAKEYKINKQKADRIIKKIA